jgi:hypothetical protein
MPCFLCEATDGAEPGRERSKQIRGRMEMTGATDKVQIVRRDASDVRFKVDAISNEGLARDGIFVAYSDILQVSVREHSTAKTDGLVAAILVVVKGLSDYADASTSVLGAL